jgi:hypothetical protein
MPHALIIAVIFVPYVLLMGLLGGYMWRQVRQHGDEEEQDGAGQEQDKTEMRLAA